MSRKQTPETFWAKVEKKDPTECWVWTGATNNTGYGTVAWHGTVHTAHRVAAWLSGMVGSPRRPPRSTDPTHVLHKCDNRRCCNPDHFFLGTFSDNMDDAYTKGRKVQPKGEKHSNAKLTDAQAREIRRRYAAGEKQIPLSVEYKVSQRAISLIVRDESYREEV